MFGCGCHARNSTLRVLYPSRKRGAGRRAATGGESGASREARQPRTAPPGEFAWVMARGSGAREGAREGAMWWRGRPCHAPRQGAAARWGHRALPPSRTGGAHGDGPDWQELRQSAIAKPHEVYARRGCARVRGEGVRGCGGEGAWRGRARVRGRECATGLGRQTREPLVGEAKKIERSKATMEVKSQGAKDSS